MQRAGKSPFGVRLRAFREAANLTQEELADRARMSVSGLSALERGARQRPHAHTLRMLSEALGLDEKEWLILLEAAGRAVGDEDRTGGGSVHPTVALTRFIGREEELRRLGELLGSHRLVTLLGMAGIGKSRLGLEAAERYGGAFADGVWVVRLDELDRDVSVPRAVVEAVGVREFPGSDSTRVLEAFFADRAALLVMDGCESVLDGCAALVSRLLGRCPRLAVLATSQASLGLLGEAIVPVLSLPVPVHGGYATELEEGGATELYVDRARLLDPDFDPSENAVTVAELCRRLDGVPLAIELAAARVRMLSPAETLRRLEDGFGVLESRRAMTRRHESLQAALEWSYSLLESAEQVLAQRLGVFVGGFTLEAMEYVCADGLGGDPLALLDELVDRSFVVAEPKRLRMLDTVRRFALDQLFTSGAENTVRERHADWFLAFAERSDPHTRGPAAERYLGGLEIERDNIRGALEWLASHEAEPARAIRLTSALAHFWRRRGGGPPADIAERLLDAEPSVALCGALDGVAWLAAQRGDKEELARFDRRLLEVAEAVGDRSYQAAGLWQLIELGVEPAPSIDHVIGLARQGSDRWRLALLLSDAALRLDLADPRRRSWLEEASVEAERVGDPWVRGAASHTLGLDDLARGDAAGGLRNIARSAELADGDRDPWVGFLVLLAFAQAALVAHDPTAALRLLAAASVIGERAGVSMQMATGAEGGTLVQRARDAVNGEVASAAWSAGARLSYREALAQAFELRDRAEASTD
jgi:predicted ATPase/DNA-binding XRE family transcriptional regulator